MLARELAAESDDEARLRTAASRSYYALFLAVRDWIGLAERDRVHRQVLSELGNRNQQGIGTLLNDLRRIREVADYQPLPHDPDLRDWPSNWREIERIVERLYLMLERAGVLLSEERDS